MLGLIKFLSPFISHHEKKINRFLFSFFQSGAESSTDGDSINQVKNWDSKSNLERLEKRADHSLLGRGDLEIVLRRLEMDFNPKEIITRHEISDLFEDENPSWGEVKEAFDVFDRNGDGFIDSNELQKVLCDLGLKEGLDLGNCRRMIAAFDENGDGRLDFEEFAKFMETSLC